MTPAPALDAERDLHEAAAELVRRRLREGARRIVVWGPPGVGRTRLMERLRGDATAWALASELEPSVETEASTLEASRLEASRLVAAGPTRGTEAVTFVDAPTLAHARAALRAATGPIVVACVERTDLDADAFVELAPLTLARSEAFLAALVRRDGVEVDEASLRALAAHAEGAPAALVRAAALCRLLAPPVWVARCETARAALVTFGRAVEHPLLVSDRPLTLGETTRGVAVLLLAAGEPVSANALEAWSPGSLDALIELRDRALLVGGDALALRHAAARGLSLDDSFVNDFRAATTRIDASTIERARAARERWVSAGDEAALHELARDEGRMRRAMERLLVGREPHVRGVGAGRDSSSNLDGSNLDGPKLDGSNLDGSNLDGSNLDGSNLDGRELKDADVDALVELALALQTRAEVHVGPKPCPELERAHAIVGSRSSELAIGYARAHRMAGDVETFERTLQAIDPNVLCPRLAARWWSEHAAGLRFHRRLDDAAEALERAIELAGREGPELEGARYVIDLGSVRYWQQRFDEAVALYARGRSIAARLRAERTEAIALANLCLCHSFAGDDAAAERAGRAAVALFEAIDDSGALGTSLGHLGILAYQYGRLDDAERYFGAAAERVAQAGYFEQQTFVSFNLVCVSIARGRLDEAEARLDALPALLARSPSPLVAMHLERVSSDLFEARGRFADALAALERGLAIARVNTAPDVEAQLEAQRSRVLARLGAHDESAAADVRAHEALTKVARPPLRAASELVLEHAAWLRARTRGESSTTERLVAALRPTWEGLGARAQIGVSAADAGGVREAALAFFADLDPHARVEVEQCARDPDRTAICVDRVGERARLPGGAELDATTRRNAFRVLRVLAEAGEEGVERDAIVEGVWPGERMRDDAASNRLHNALAQLRGAGLAEHLMRDGTRYRLVGVAVKLVRGLT